MLSISLKAEDELVATLTAIKAERNADGGCCLHIRGLALGDHLFNQLPHVLDTWIEDQQGKILVCEDRDIFVFSRRLTKNLYANIRAVLYVLLGYEPATGDTITTLYDYNKQYFVLEDLLKSKVERKKAEQAMEDEKHRAHFMNAQLNSNLLATLSHRKSSRHEFQIQVLENDPFSRHMIALALTPAHDPLFSETGMGGLRDYMLVAPDILFLGTSLPDMQAHKILEKVLQYDRNAFVVILGDQGEAEKIEPLLANGAKGYVRKPFAHDKLLEYIDLCAGQKIKVKEACC